MPQPTLPPLKCIGIVLCESAFRIAGSTNMVLVNTFHTLSAKTAPVRFPKITVFYSVTEGRGTYDMEVAVVLARTGQDTMVGRDQYTVRDPLSIGDVQIILNNVPLPEAGKYWIEVRCNGEIIGQRPFYLQV